VKLNGRNVGGEQTLWGAHRLVWGFASATLAALLVARWPMTLASATLGALSSGLAVVLTHAVLKPLPTFGGASPRLSACDSAFLTGCLLLTGCLVRCRGLLEPHADAAHVGCCGAPPPRARLRESATRRAEAARSQRRTRHRGVRCTFLSFIHQMSV